MKIYFFLFQYRMEGFSAGIIVWISLTAKGMRDFFPVRSVFRRPARILASRVTMQNDSFCIPDVQAGIPCRFHCQFRCHGCATERSPCSAICLRTRLMPRGVPAPPGTRHSLTAPYLRLESPKACFTFLPDSSYAIRLFEGTQTRAL